MTPSSGPAAPTTTTAPDSLINTNDGRQYWEAVSADLDGMLGGYPYVTKVDLQGSKNFLAKMGIGSKEGLKTVKLAMDGGAGIGRITKGLLLHIAEQVDIVEPTAKFTEGLSMVAGVNSVSNIGLEEWTPPPESQYDLIWTQWCLNHLTDQQIVAFLERCKTAIVPETGFIIVKENLNTGLEDLFDEMDSSVTRRDEKFLELFKEAGLKLLRCEIQRGMPKGLFPVKTYALR